MSQRKVDSYKAGKNNRSRTAKKEKLIDRLEILAWVAICVAMVAWIGFSAYAKITAKIPTIYVMIITWIPMPVRNVPV